MKWKKNLKNVFWLIHWKNIGVDQCLKVMQLTLRQISDFKHLYVYYSKLLFFSASFSVLLVFASSFEIFFNSDCHMYNFYNIAINSVLIVILKAFIWLSVKARIGNRETEWGKCGEWEELGWEWGESEWNAWECRECGEWEGNKVKLEGNAGNLGENAGNRGGNAVNMGGNAGNRIKIEKVKWKFIKSNFYFFAKIEKKKRN